MTSSRIALITLTSVAVLGVSACGSDSDPSNPDDTVTMSSSQSATSESEDSSTSESPSESESSSESTSSDTASDTASDSDGGLAAVTAAIDAAESETGGIAYEVDDQDDDGSWEIDLAKDGTSIEVEVSADGKVTEQKKENLDANDRKGLAVVKTTIAEGIEKALAEIDGTFDEAELEEKGGTWYWEVEIVTDSDGDREVLVDATNGEVSVKN